MPTYASEREGQVQHNPSAEHLDVQEASVQRFQLDVIDLLLALARRKRFILQTTIVVTVLALLGSLLVRNSYESTAVIMPPTQQQSISNLLSGQLGSLAALSGGGGASAALGLKNPNDIYAQLLLSKTVAKRLISLYDLKKRYKDKTEEDTIKTLAKHTIVDLDKSSLIRITVTADDPVFASQLANAYVDQLHDLNTTLALTDSSQRRAFYEQQLDQEKLVLANAELQFQEIQKKTGLLQPTGQADMVARNIASLRAQITVGSAQLQSLGVFATAQNPDYQRLRSELSSLQAQLASEENSNKSAGAGDIEIPTSKIPESATEYTRKLRELRLQENIYELLIKQLEAAKIDEAKAAPLIQVVDRAYPPERKAGPHRALITIGALFATFFLTVVWCLASFLLNLLRQDVEIGPKLHLLRTTLSGRR